MTLLPLWAPVSLQATENWDTIAKTQCQTLVGIPWVRRAWQRAGAGSQTAEGWGLGRSHCLKSDLSSGLPSRPLLPRLSGKPALAGLFTPLAPYPTLTVPCPRFESFATSVFNLCVLPWTINSKRTETTPGLHASVFFSHVFIADVLGTVLDAEDTSENR